LSFIFVTAEVIFPDSRAQLPFILTVPSTFTGSRVELLFILTVPTVSPVHGHITHYFDRSN